MAKMYFVDTKGEFWRDIATGDDILAEIDF
jgi:hypothetical protein